MPGADPGPQERPGAEAHVGTPTGQAQSCPLLLTDGLQGTKFYEPGDNPRENETSKLLQWRWKGKYGY